MEGEMSNKKKFQKIKNLKKVMMLGLQTPRQK